MKKSQNLMRWVSASLMAVALALCTGSLAMATPADEITRAVIVAGAPNVKQATAKQFVTAFTAVIAKVKSKDLPLYVSVAVKMRPDLAPQITVVALNACSLDRRVDGKDGKDYKQIREPCPDRDAIIQAAIDAAPNAREAILAAVGSPANQTALLQPPRVNAVGENPAHFGGPNEGDVQSPEQRPKP